MASRKRTRAGDGQQQIDDIKAHIEKRLFVGKLPRDVEERDLREAFANYGQLIECKLVPGKSIAFVGFETWGAAHSALLDMDNQEVFKDSIEPLSVSFAERTRDVGRRGGAKYAKGQPNSRIFVGGLPGDATQDDIERLMLEYGQIQQVKLLSNLRSTISGFVTFYNWGQALDAIEALDGQESSAGGSGSDQLSVALAEPKDGEGGAVGAGADGPLSKRRRTDARPAHVDRSELDALLNCYRRAVEGAGLPDVCEELHRSIMALRARLGRESQWNSRGTDILPGRSDIAPVGAHPSGGVGERLGPSLARNQKFAVVGERSERGSDLEHRLFIQGLPKECTDEELLALVDQISDPKHRELTECRTLPGKGSGYLTFTDRVSAEEALEALHDRRVKGWQELLRVQWSEPRRGSGRRVATVSTGTRGGRHTSSWRRAGEGGHDNCDNEDADQAERTRLFVGQFERGAGQELLLDLFEPYGEIAEFKYLEEKAVAYVTFVRPDDAQRALTELHEMNVPGVSRKEGLNIKFAKPLNPKR